MRTFKTKLTGPLTFVVALLLMVLLSSVMILFLERIEQSMRTQWGQSLSAVMQTTHDAFHHWSKIQQEMVNGIASNPELIQLAEKLLELPRNKDALEGSFELDDVRNFMLPAIEAHRYIGFRIISTDHFVVAARHPKGVGATPALSHYSSFLERSFNGEIVLTPPFPFKHPYYQGALRPALFAIAPIRNVEQKIIASLALHLEPTAVFNDTAALARIGNTGESYVFDNKGRVLSGLRFEKQLQESGILQDNETSILNVSLREPGVDIRQQPVNPAIYQNRPLTKMATLAIQGKDGIDTNGYRNYRGVEVLGAWHWEPELGLGIVVEMDAEEALGPYAIMRTAALWALGFSMLLISLMITVLIIQRRSAVLFAIKETESRNATEKAYEELSKSQELNQLLLESSAEGIYGIDTQGNCIFANPSCVQLLGYDSDNELLGKNSHTQFHHHYPDGTYYPESSCPVRLTIEKGQTNHVENDVFWRRDGTSFPVEYRSLAMKKGDEIIGVVTTFSDITKRKETERILIQTEKMMSVGGLAAGMAHELNNPLGGVLQGIQNIKRRLSPENVKNTEVARELELDLNVVWKYFEQRGIAQFLQGINDAGERAAVIVHNMLQFARKAELDLQPECINSLIDNALELSSVDYDLKKKYDFRQIEIIRNYDDTLPPVACIASEIQQVLINIFRNAAQALFEGKIQHPHITVRSYSKQNMVCFDIEDNGPGMLKETQGRVFDPFFTTRKVGEGTGLGLSVSYFIVTEEHSGNMSVDSQLGKGTTFTVCLPIK